MPNKFWCPNYKLVSSDPASNPELDRMQKEWTKSEYVCSDETLFRVGQRKFVFKLLVPDKTTDRVRRECMEISSRKPNTSAGNYSSCIDIQDEG